MSEQTPESTPATVPLVRRRILWRLFLSLCLFSLIAFSLLAWYVTTDSFQQRVRRQVVASVEKMTGGRVELGELHTIPFRLRVDARNVTIHGHEASDQAPFLHIERLQAQMKIISLLSTTVGLHSLVLDHPVVHVIDLPRWQHKRSGAACHRVLTRTPSNNSCRFRFRTSRSTRGELLWEDKKVPFEFDARDLALLLHYSLLRRRYEAHIVAGSVATHVQDYPSFVWRADASLILAREHADISSLRLTSGQSEILFAGSVHDFHNPQLSGNYHGQAEFSEIAALLRQPQVPRRRCSIGRQSCLEPPDFFNRGNACSERHRMVEPEALDAQRPPYSRILSYSRASPFIRHQGELARWRSCRAMPT